MMFGKFRYGTHWHIQAPDGSLCGSPRTLVFLTDNIPLNLFDLPGALCEECYWRVREKAGLEANPFRITVDSDMLSRHTASNSKRKESR